MRQKCPTLKQLKLKCCGISHNHKWISDVNVQFSNVLNLTEWFPSKSFQMEDEPIYNKNHLDLIKTITIRWIAFLSELFLVSFDVRLSKGDRLQRDPREARGRLGPIPVAIPLRVCDRHDGAVLRHLLTCSIPLCAGGILVLSASWWKMIS